MNKKTNRLGIAIAVITLLTVCAEGVYALSTTTAPNGVIIPDDITFIPDPENAKVVFDLHDVIIKWNRSWHLIKEHTFKKDNMLLPLYLFNIPLVIRVGSLLSRGANGAEYTQLLEQQKKSSAAQLIRNIAAEQNHIPGTVYIMQELKKAGYAIDLASNIGKRHLSDLQSKPEHDKVFELFDNLFVVDYAIVPVIKKPDGRYFQLYNQTFNKEHKSVIFVDNDINNVRAAVQAGMVGIHFKHAQQLLLALQSLGVLS